VLPIVAPPRTLEGLPDDPDARAAMELLRGLDPAAGTGLRLGSALFGGEAADQAGEGRAAGRADSLVIRSARAALERARARLPHDARARVFLAHLDLAEGERLAGAGDPVGADRALGRAERAYLAVADGRDEVPESRLGLGVLLESRAAREPEEARRRGFRFQAIAQFAAVKQRDRAYATALYNRALLLARVERTDEARRWTRAYLARDSTSAWAERLRVAVEAGR
jgi:hypothetical protein